MSIPTAAEIRDAANAFWSEIASCEELCGAETLEIRLPDMSKGEQNISISGGSIPDDARTRLSASALAFMEAFWKVPFVERLQFELQTESTDILAFQALFDSFEDALDDVPDFIEDLTKRLTLVSEETASDTGPVQQYVVTSHFDRGDDMTRVIPATSTRQAKLLYATLMEACYLEDDLLDQIEEVTILPHEADPSL